MQAPPAVAQAGRLTDPPNGASAGPDWLDRLAALPGAGVLVVGLRHWWHRHPARTAAVLAADAAKAQLQPLAREHPVAVVLVAGAVGMLLVASRPWRWALRPVLLAGLLPRLMKKAVQLAINPQHAVARSPWSDLVQALIQQAAVWPPMAAPPTAARPVPARSTDDRGQSPLH